MRRVHQRKPRPIRETSQPLDAQAGHPTDRSPERNKMLHLDGALGARYADIYSVKLGARLRICDDDHDIVALRRDLRLLPQNRQTG